MKTTNLKIGTQNGLLNPTFRVVAPHRSGEAAISAARRSTDLLFRLLDPAAIYERPVPARNRLIFYLGHLEAFDYNLLGARERGLAPHHATFDRLFAFGIDPDSSSLPADQPGDWPRLAEVQGYVRNARERVDELVATASADALAMCVEHRLMHAETLAYLFHDLPYVVKRRPVAVSAPAGRPVGRRFIDIPAGVATLGKKRDGSFGWDNEYREHTVSTPEFAIGSHRVTNAEYLEFVREGSTPSHYWTRREGNWFYRSMFEEAPLPLDAPVYVTHAQAAAYAALQGKRLPSEAQYHRAAYGSPDGGERRYPWGDDAPQAYRGNFGFQFWDPVDVYAFPDGASAFGVSQMAGNGWEWTRDAFSPFPGFEPHPFYAGYSADFFDGQHYVLKGASCRTDLRFLRRSFRNWFRPDYPHVYATFRLVEC